MAVFQQPIQPERAGDDLQRLTQYSQCKGLKAFDIGDFLFHMGEKITEGSCNVLVDLVYQ